MEKPFNSPTPPGPSRCPTCGGAAKLEIRLPDGTSVPAANMIEAQHLLRAHQRRWKGEDLFIRVTADCVTSQNSQPK